MALPPIYNPVVPCVHPIPGGMFPGRMIRVQGTVPHGAERFAINLQCGPNTDPRDDIALHLNFRFVEMCVVRNHLTAMSWGQEDTAGGMPLARGASFEALLLVDPMTIKIALNGSHFCEFVHRVPYQRISHITVDGDVDIQLIGFEGAQPQPQYMPDQLQQPYGAYGVPPPAYGAPGYGAPQGVTGPPSPKSEDKNPPNAPRDTSQEVQNDDINERISPLSSVASIDRTPDRNYTPITFLSNTISIEDTPIPVLTVRLDSNAELISNAESEDYDEQENKQFDEEEADDDSVNDNVSFGNVRDYHYDLISFDHCNAKAVTNLINDSLSPIKIPYNLSYDNVGLKAKDSKHTRQITNIDKDSKIKGSGSKQDNNNNKQDNSSKIKGSGSKQDNNNNNNKQENSSKIKGSGSEQDNNNKQENSKKTFGIPIVYAKDVMSISYTSEDKKQKRASDVIQPSSTNRKENLPIRIGSTGKTKVTFKRNDSRAISAEISNKKSNEARNTLTIDMRSSNDEKRVDKKENQADNTSKANSSTDSPKVCTQKSLDQIQNEALDEKLADIERSRNIPENAEKLKEKAQKINVIRQVIVDQSKVLEELKKYQDSVPNEDVLIKQGRALLTIQDSINNLFGIKYVPKEIPVTLGGSVSKDVAKHITPARRETTVIVKTPNTKKVNNDIIRDEKLNLRLQSQLNNLHELAEMEVMKFQDTKKLFDKNKLNESDDNFEVNLDDDFEDDEKDDNVDDRDEDEEYRDEDEDERDEDEEDRDEIDDTGKKGPVTDDKVKKVGPEFEEDMIKGEMLHDVSNTQQISHKTSHTSKKTDIIERDKTYDTSEKNTKEQVTAKDSKVKDSGSEERNKTNSLEKTDNNRTVDIDNIDSKDSKAQIIETPNATIDIENTKVNGTKDSGPDDYLDNAAKDTDEKDHNTAKVVTTVQGFSIKMSTEVMESNKVPVNPASTIIVNNLYKSTTKEVGTNMKTKEPSWSIMSESTYGTDSDLGPNTNESDVNTIQSVDLGKNKLDKTENEDNPTSIEERSKDKLDDDKNVIDNNNKNDMNIDKGQETKSFEPKSIITSNLVKVNNESEKNSDNILKCTNEANPYVKLEEKDNTKLENEPSAERERESDNITKVNYDDKVNIIKANEIVCENLESNIENQDNPATAKRDDTNSSENKYTTEPIEKRDTKEIKNLVNEVKNRQNKVAVIQSNQNANPEMSVTNQDSKIGHDTENYGNVSELDIVISTGSDNSNTSVDNKKHDPTDIMKSISSLRKQPDVYSVSSKGNSDTAKDNESLPIVDIRNSTLIDVDQTKPMFYRIIHQPPYARANVDGSITPIKQLDDIEKQEEQSFLIQVVIPESKSPNQSLHQQDTLKAKSKTVLVKNANQENPEIFANDNLKQTGKSNKDQAQIEPTVVTIAPRNVVNIIDSEQTEEIEESVIGKRWKTIKRGILRHLPFYRYHDDD